jgi:alpha-beta hydrolase superfamily lysophospholipase
MTFEFPVGYQRLHEDVGLNFQLNRFLPGARLEDLRRAATRIRDLSDWRRELWALAEEAEKEGRLSHAGTYYRMSEFFAPPHDPEGARAYARFREIFEETTRGEAYERRAVAYEGRSLPALRLPREGAKDLLVLHGGFDSCLEDQYPMARFLQGAGFEVVLFEGPGQGAALRLEGLPMTPAWDRPVRAVLDAFAARECTLLGVSLGGALALRAAAFEPRVRRVVAFDVLDDFLDCLAHARGAVLGLSLRLGLALRAARLLDLVMERRMRDDLMVAWAIPHGMYVMGADTPHGFAERARRFHTRDVSARIDQDVLLLAGSADHYVPVRQLWRQARRLRHARSVTARLFTAAEHAHNHCQVGNVGLALRTIAAWVEERVTARPQGEEGSPRGPSPMP